MMYRILLIKLLEGFITNIFPVSTRTLWYTMYSFFLGYVCSGSYRTKIIESFGLRRYATKGSFVENE